MEQYWFVFQGNRLLLQKAKGRDTAYAVPFSVHPPMPLPEGGEPIPLPLLNGARCSAFETAKADGVDMNYEFMPLRASYDVLPQAFYQIAGKAAELIYWDKNTRFCGCCGAPLMLASPISKHCPKCGNEVWPQLAVAAIVLVRKPSDEVLLVHAHNLRGHYYGLVAGFVETGETLEDCVRREVMEETAIHIKNLHYFGSQSWPYPCGLMIGFYADYDGGEVRLQRNEIACGGWFDRHKLPPLPGRVSIARRMIDAWLQDKLE